MTSGVDTRDLPLDPAKELARWQTEGDPRLWKLIVSPEFGERVDLDRLTRDLMARMEKDLGTKLEWLAVTHFNTEHPHVHIALRGIREDKTALDLPRDYVRHGVRAIAEDLCTRQLGHRNQLDAIESERREIDERRFTSLDRAINRATTVELAETASNGEQHIDARLLVLQQMGLAEPSDTGVWLVRRDFETVLKAMQRSGDRQKMLASHGTLLSDQRLPLVVLDMRKLKTLEGRVLAHGEEELGNGAGRHYLLLEGTDAKVHLIYYTQEMEEARPALTIRDFGNAETILSNGSHIRETVKIAVARGSVPSEVVWGGWLGRYQASIMKIANEMNIFNVASPSGRDR
jgi:type IV secretory pathway VirD2 relaxase